MKNFKALILFEIIWLSCYFIRKKVPIKDTFFSGTTPLHAKHAAYTLVFYKNFVNQLAFHTNNATYSLSTYCHHISILLEMKSLHKIFGTQVRYHRKQKGMSQEELASLAGLHRTYIGSIERGERNVSLTNIEKISSSLGVSVINLLVEPNI